MDRLIDDLLSLSRIELTEHQNAAQPLDLGKLVSRMVAGFEPRLKERNLDLSLRIEPDCRRSPGTTIRWRRCCKTCWITR